MRIHDLLTTKECKTVEFLGDSASESDLLKTITAFSNSAGGVVLIGVDGENRAVTGIKNALDEAQRIDNIIADSISPRLSQSVHVMTWEGRQLLTIRVYPSTQRPHFLKSLGEDSGTYVRVGSTNRQADRLLIEQLNRSTTCRSFDQGPMPKFNPDTLDTKYMSGLFSENSSWSDSTTKSFQLVTEHQGRLVPTVGGVLLFGLEKEVIFPDAWIQCGRFRGLHKAVILDQLDARGLLPVILEKAFEFVQKHAMKSAQFGELRRIDVWNVPLTAIQEALVNAVVHTDYSRMGSPIRLMMFDNRIEIENPGTLAPGMNFDDVKSGVSVLRNRVIGRVFKELKLIEQWGSGYKTMYESCINNGFPAPVFEEVGFNIRVTFFLKNEGSSVNDSVDSLILDQISQNENQGGTTVKALVNATGLVDRSVRRHLSRLRSSGRIVAIGKSVYDPDKRFYPAKTSEIAFFG